jgi:hypothetical protein
MDGKQMGKGLNDGMKILIGIVLSLGVLIVSAIIILLIVGVLGNTATSGTIPVSTAINTSIVALETTTTTSMTSIMSNLTLIIGLVALVVILAVIGWFVFGKNGKSASNNADF